MAQTITTLPELVTSADGNNHVLTINQEVFNKDPNPIVSIEVVTGSFNFAVGEDASNSSASYTAGQKLVLTLRNGNIRTADKKLNFKAANASETFKISY